MGLADKNKQASIDNLDIISISSANTEDTTSTLINVTVPSIPLSKASSVQNLDYKNKISSHLYNKKILRNPYKCKTNSKRGQKREQNRLQLNKLYTDGKLIIIEEQEDYPTNFLEFNDSIFSEVLSNSELKATWQVFSSLSGEAQDCFIKYIEKQNDKFKINNFKIKNESILKESDSGFDENVILNKSGTDITDNERLKEAQTSYMNLKKSIRNSMKRGGLNQTPLKFLKSIETEIIDHFTGQNKDFAFIKNDLNSYQRSWLYRTCDYYRLKIDKSQSPLENFTKLKITGESSDSDTTENFTKVYLTKNFKVPSIKFSQFLEIIL